MIKKYDITQCAFYKCQNKRRLEKLLLLRQNELKHLEKIIKYETFETNKKDSNEKRIITAPCSRLKSIQGRILSLLQKIKRPDWLISGEKGKSYLDNGEMHRDSSFLLKLDIKNFYDNCTREYVYQFFLRKLKTSPDVAMILTNITTYDNKIPTGSPASQIVAFYAYVDMFMEIKYIAEKHNCLFSLYVDDMVFSSQFPFKLRSLQRDIDRILRSYGHKLKIRKARYYSKNENKLITGVGITPTHQMVTGNQLRYNIYTSFKKIKNAKKSGQIDAYRGELESLQGRVQAARRIQEGIFPEINKFVQMNIAE